MIDDELRERDFIQREKTLHDLLQSVLFQTWDNYLANRAQQMASSCPAAAEAYPTGWGRITRLFGNNTLGEAFLNNICENWNTVAHLLTPWLLLIYSTVSKWCDKMCSNVLSIPPVLLKCV